MNKAFVREPDGEVPEPLPEIPLPPGPNPVTAGGHALIVAALDAVDRRLADQREPLERTEAERLRRDRRYWAARLDTARTTAPPADPDEIGFGSHVTVAWPGRGEVALRIVGDDEADPTRGLIGWRAPVAVHTQDAEAVLSVVERHPLDRAGQHLWRGCMRTPVHRSPVYATSRIDGRNHVGSRRGHCRAESPQPKTLL